MSDRDSKGQAVPKRTRDMETAVGGVRGGGAQAQRRRLGSRTKMTEKKQREENEKFNFRC